MATELQGIQVTEAKPLLPGQDAAQEAAIAAAILLDQGQEYDVETPFGSVHVTIHGSPRGNRPAILTYHDVGLNHKTCFNSLFKFEDMLEITKNFVVCHIDAPGQQEGAAPFPTGYQYPSMEQLCEMLTCVLQYFNFRSIIGVGVGAGAYILAMFAKFNPDLVEGLVLLNIDHNAKGWIDWAASKITGLTSSLSDMILAHLFSQEEMSNNCELVTTYRALLTDNRFLGNAEHFWNAYNSNSTQPSVSVCGSGRSPNCGPSPPSLRIGCTELQYLPQPGLCQSAAYLYCLLTVLEDQQVLSRPKSVCL
ncbi:protein NDRG2-like [Mobula birostris]|uniref:protein NDRG2-like n=1 Tax=Mobula birostris TaxID=1983395 RepID=UPI003B2824E2